MRSSLPRNAGFTLIELMIVVAIVAILAAIALPAYQDYVKRGYLVEGTQQLASARAKLEQYYQDARRYDTNGAYTSPCDTLSSTNTPRWSFACSGQNQTGYLVTAQGLGPISNFTYTIDQTNLQKTTSLPTGWGSVPQNCWITKKGGTC